MSRLIAPALLGVLLSACASLPSEVSVAEYDLQPAYSELAAHADVYNGQHVALGGMIIAVTNQKDSSTVEVLQLPIYDSGRPNPDTDKAGGRFLIRFERFLDPEIYSRGKMITVRGNISGQTTSSIGEHPYTYLSLQGDGLHLWPEQPDEVQVQYYMGIHAYPYYLRPVQPPRH